MAEETVQKTEWVCYEQRVEGNETAEGNKVLERSPGFRTCVDVARNRARELKDAGHECKVIKELQTQNIGFGYRVTEKPADDKSVGAQWNLLVLKGSAVAPKKDLQADAAEKTRVAMDTIIGATPAGAPAAVKDRIAASG